jgi:hypothetical protein
MALLVSVPISCLSPIFAPTLFLGKMMKRENRGLGEENEKEFFFPFWVFFQTRFVHFPLFG